MNDIFLNKTALITGASGGLGKNLALLLAKQGCNLHLLGRTTKKIEKVSIHIQKECPDVKIVQSIVDFADVSKVSEFLCNIRKCDILINCAGTFPIKNIHNSTLGDYETCFNINVRAPFLFSKSAAGIMKKQAWGRIVNIASSSAYAGSPDTGLYCASKHALLGLSRSLYHELKPHGIRVYTVSPGSIQTDMGATDTRQDFSTFLNPMEVAEYIVHIISYNNEMISEEVRLNRNIIR